MSNVPSELKYTKEHEWVLSIDDSRYRVGITDFAQGALGDIVYIQLPRIGDEVESGKVCGEVESTKSVSEIYAPLSGKVVDINKNLENTPETINGDPYGSGWIFEIEARDENEVSNLLTATDYQNLTA
jgi:glycine cleavage system H protein